MRLDIGAGDTLEEGWTSWDIRDGKDARKIDMPDGSVDEIRACHVLEHLPIAASLPTLREWNRVLKPGGRLYLAVPDFEAICLAFIKRVPDPMLDLYVVGGQTNPHDFHLSLWWIGKIETALAVSGFDRVREMPPEGPNTSTHWISLNVEAFKP